MRNDTTISNMPLKAFPAMRATTANELQEQMFSLFGGGEILDLPDGEDGLDAKGNLCKLSKCEIWYGSYGVSINIKFVQKGFFRLQYCRSGSAAILINQERVLVDENSSCILPTGRGPIIGEYGRDYQQMILRIEAKNLEGKLAALVGAPITRGLEFDPVVNLETPGSQHLRRMVELLVHDLDSVESGFPSIAMVEFEEAMLVAFLCANRHNYSHLLERQKSGGAPWQVRRIEEYIEANWDQPISVEDIVTVTGASARSIFRAFRQSRGYSPLSFAKQVRLRHAQRMLKSGDVTKTVTDVAFACGFSDLGRFSKDYRRAYDESPSQVLNRAKGGGSANH